MSNQMNRRSVMVCGGKMSSSRTRHVEAVMIHGLGQRNAWRDATAWIMEAEQPESTAAGAHLALDCTHKIAGEVPREEDEPLLTALGDGVR